MFLFDLIFDLSYDLGLMWLAFESSLPKVRWRGDGAKKRRDGIRLWHCRDCCYEWAGSIQSVINGEDGRKRAGPPD